MNNLILIGMPWCWKTTLWKLISEKLGYIFIDFDDDILEKKYNQTVWSLVRNMSDWEFKKLEEQSALQINMQKSVLSTSGSLPYSRASMNHLKTLWKIVYIKVNIWEIQQRLDKMKTDRIIWLLEANFEQLFYEREKLYSSHADIIFEYTWNNLEKISNNLIHKIWRIHIK